MPTMPTITEADFVLHLSEKAITDWHLQEQEDGTFSLVVRTSWRNADLVLCPAKDKTRPRTWKDFSALVRYIKTHIPAAKECRVRLYQPPRKEKRRESGTS